MAGKEDKNKHPLVGGDAAEDDEIIYSLDSMFEKLGHCGRFQVLLVSLGYFPLLPATWGLMFMVFGNYNPGFQCGDDPLLNDTHLPELAGMSTQTTPPSEGNFSGHRTSLCTCDSIKSHQNLTFSKAASTVVTEWSLVCGDSWKSSTIISVQMLGVLVGSVSGGQIGDRFGRKFSVHGGCVILAVTNIIAIFSVSWVMYAVIRFLIGFAVGTILSSVAIYNMEFIPSFWRAFLGTFPFWSLSTFTFGLCAMAFKNWKHVHMATAVVALLAFLPVFWLPESMRYLTVHDQLERANKVVKKIARLNKKPLPDTSIMTKIAAVEKEAFKERSSYTYLDLFHSSIRKYTFVLGLNWFIFSVSGNTIVFGLKALSGDFFVNLLVLFSLPIPARSLNVIVATKLGRKTAVSSGMFLCSIFSFLVVGIQLAAPADTRGAATTALALIANMFQEVSWGVSVALIAELFPTGVRSMAFAFCNAVGRVGGMIAPYLVPKQSLPMWAVFLLIAILQLISFVSALTLPESKGRPLHDNLQGKVPRGQRIVLASDA